MLKKFTIAYLLLFSLILSAQNVENIKVNNPDSTYQEYLTKKKQEAAINRAEKEQSIRNARPDTVVILLVHASP